MAYNIKTALYRHKEGTKGYEISVISEPANDEYIVFRRWGKVDVFDHGGGQTKFQKFRSLSQALIEFDKLEHERESRGYTSTTRDSFSALSGERAVATFRARLSGQVFADLCEMVCFDLAVEQPKTIKVDKSPVTATESKPSYGDWGEF